ncbi:unnamed protein product [Calypogeia fissa]
MNDLECEVAAFGARQLSLTRETNGSSCSGNGRRWGRNGREEIEAFNDLFFLGKAFERIGRKLQGDGAVFGKMKVASAKEGGCGSVSWRGTEMAFGEWCSGNESMEWGSGGGNSGATVMWEAWERILERARGQSGEARQWRKGYDGEAMEVWRRGECNFFGENGGIWEEKCS